MFPGGRGRRHAPGPRPPPDREKAGGFAEPEVVMMSISERERQTLESIENGLVRSAPKLASMLAIFTRLTVNEKMPARRPARRAPGLRAVAGLTAGPPSPERPRRIRLGRVARGWLWLAIAAALLTLTITLGHGTGRAACTPTRAGATCQHLPAPARPAANQPSGS